MMKVLHAVAAALTVLLYLARRHCVLARVCLTKRSSIFEPPLCSYRDSSQTSVLSPIEDMFCARGGTRGGGGGGGGSIDNVCIMPKYKRDPDIEVDNENIGVHPRG